MTHNYKESYIGNFDGKVSIDLLRLCFTPNFSRGVLYWAKDRPLCHFETKEGRAQYKTVREGKDVISSHTRGSRYKKVELFKKTYPVSHILWALKYGEWPSKLFYKDGNRTNASIDNLTTECTVRVRGIVFPPMTENMRIINQAFSSRSAVV